MPYTTKYGTVTTERGSIPDDEPVFILRASDVHAAAAIAYYQSLCVADREVGNAHASDMEQVRQRFTSWRAANPGRMKVPDTTPGQMPRM